MSELKQIRWGRVLLLAGLSISVSTGFGTLGALAVSRQWDRRETRFAEHSTKRILALEAQIQQMTLSGQQLSYSNSSKNSVTWEQWSEFEVRRLNGAKETTQTPSKQDWSGVKAGTKMLKIDIDVVDKDLREVVSEIGRRVGQNIRVSPGIEETITLELRDLNWVYVLSIIAKTCRCKISREEGGVIVLTQPEKVTIEFSDANVRTVLVLLAAYTGKNIVLDPEIRGSVSLSLKDVHWEKAIQAVCAAHGDFVVFEDSDREILIAKARPRKSRR